MEKPFTSEWREREKKNGRGRYRIADRNVEAREKRNGITNSRNVENEILVQLCKVEESRDEPR